MLYEYLNEHRAADDTGVAANAGSTTPVPLPAVRPSQHTLSPADLAPPWRGPPTRKETHNDRPT